MRAEGADESSEPVLGSALAALAAARLTTTSPFEAGESLIGTLQSELVIGVVDELTGLEQYWA